MYDERASILGINDFQELQPPACEVRVSEFAEDMTIFIVSELPHQGHDQSVPNYYRIELQTQYTGLNAQESDEISDGYNYTQVLSLIKQREMDLQVQDDDLKLFLQQKLPVDDHVRVRVKKADRISHYDFLQGTTVPEAGMSIRHTEGSGKVEFCATVHVDGAYGYFGSEHLAPQPIVFKIQGHLSEQLSQERQSLFFRKLERLMNEAFAYGSDGGEHISWYSMENGRDYKFLRAHEFEGDNKFLTCMHRIMQGMDAPRTIEYMIAKTHSLLENSDTSFIREPNRQRRSEEIIKELRNDIGVQLEDLSISGQKNPQYLEYDSDTMHVIIRRVPNKEA